MNGIIVTKRDLTTHGKISSTINGNAMLALIVWVIKNSVPYNSVTDGPILLQPIYMHK